jgi:hypothetical protein
MISFIFISLAAICNAFMDAFENENFYESIFRNRNAKFWYKRESWKYAPKIFGWKFDAWHLFKTLMIVCICTAIVAYDRVFSWWLDFLIVGALWNIFFVLFYHKIFRIK